MSSHPYLVSFLLEGLPQGLLDTPLPSGGENVRVQESLATGLLPLGRVKEQPTPSDLQHRTLGEPAILDLHPPTWQAGQTSDGGDGGDVAGSALTGGLTPVESRGVCPRTRRQSGSLALRIPFAKNP